MRNPQVRETATVVIVSDSVPTRSARRTARRDARRADLTVRRLDPEVLATALRLAEGDTRRLRILADGSILVVNG